MPSKPLLVETDGRSYFGAEAVFRTLKQAKGHSLVLWCYHHLPGFAPLAERFYRTIARHRLGISKLKI